MTNFATPTAQTGVDLGELHGSLLYIKVNTFTAAVQTTFGPTDTVSVDIAVLDGAKKGTVTEDALLFPKVLVSSLKKYADTGQIVLGRLVRGTAKPGQSAPWLLEAPTQDDIAVAHKYEAYVKTQAPAVAPAAADEPF